MWNKILETVWGMWDWVGHLIYTAFVWVCLGIYYVTHPKLWKDDHKQA